jgi:hypothetical protein
LNESKPKQSFPHFIHGSVLPSLPSKYGKVFPIHHGQDEKDGIHTAFRRTSLMGDWKILKKCIRAVLLSDLLIKTIDF